MANARIENDFLGKREVPTDVYWGIQTLRATENFPISGMRPHWALIRAAAAIKKAAAQANYDAGRIPKRIAKAICTAAQEIYDGKLHDQFVVDVFQAGAGTSFHMNVNEVVANRAIEFLAGTRGQYELVHPNDHVNLGQSTNDVFPTAMRLSAMELVENLLSSIDTAIDAFDRKARQFARIVKSGRTHLQDATPVTLGSEFAAYSRTLMRSRRRIMESAEELAQLGIGGSAVGTGVNTHTGFAKEVVRNLKAITGLNIQCADNLQEAMQSMAPFTAVSSSLKILALELIRIANDLRLMSSGPTTGLSEIKLPAVQPGSSIMPGKVNPVMAEVTNMVAFHVVGNDTTISLAAQAGQLELNVMMPVIIHNLLESIDILAHTLELFADRCVRGIEADQKRCLRYAESSVSLVTVLSPKIGYHKASAVAKEAIERGKTIRDIVVEKKLLPAAEADAILAPERMMGPTETASSKPSKPKGAAKSAQKARKRSAKKK